MSDSRASIGARPIEPVVVRPTRLSDLFQLAKPGIVRMVLVTTGVGFILAALGRGWTIGGAAWVVVWCMIGTAISAAGANALNMAMEVRRDGLMERTKRRPMPAGRMPSRVGAMFGGACAIIGVTILWFGTNPAAAIVSAATIASYVLLYTPMKPVSTLSTIVGAVPGALPPLIGWAAGTGFEGGASMRSLAEPGGWTIFLIMFVWQIPHFLALAWKYREDYGRAGHRVLPVTDPGGVRTSFVVLLWSVLLVPISLLPIPAMPDRLGWGYAIFALLCGVLFAAAAARLWRVKNEAAAMKVFFASIMYLPAVLLGMVGDALWPF